MTRAADIAATDLLWTQSSAGVAPLLREPRGAVARLRCCSRCCCCCGGSGGDREGARELEAEDLVHCAHHRFEVEGGEGGPNGSDEPPGLRCGSYGDGSLHHELLDCTGDGRVLLRDPLELQGRPAAGEEQRLPPCDQHDEGEQRSPVLFSQACAKPLDPEEPQGAEGRDGDEEAKAGGYPEAAIQS